MVDALTINHCNVAHLPTTPPSRSGAADGMLWMCDAVCGASGSCVVHLRPGVVRVIRYLVATVMRITNNENKYISR